MATGSDIAPLTRVQQLMALYAGPQVSVAALLWMVAIQRRWLIGSSGKISQYST